jgi:hypothetical protein
MSPSALPMADAWIAVLAGLIPILGIAAAGAILYVIVRKGEAPPDE